MVEYQRNAQLTINVDNMKQVIYIYKCEGTTVIVKGKANSITMGAFVILCPSLSYV